MAPFLFDISGMPSVALWLYRGLSCEESCKLNGALISASRQTARTWRVSYYSSTSLFIWVNSESQWKFTCFYKPSPLRNTCTEQQAHCFSSCCIVKIERRARRSGAGLLNHSYFLAPHGWLKSSCQEHWLIRATLILALLCHRNMLFIPNFYYYLSYLVD